MKNTRTVCIALLALLMSVSAFAQKGKVLFVLSEADTLLLKKGKKKRQTGVFLNEFYLAHKAIADAGDVRVAEISAHQLWDLARQYFYEQKDYPKIFKLCLESFRYRFRSIYSKLNCFFKKENQWQK